MMCPQYWQTYVVRLMRLRFPLPVETRRTSTPICFIAERLRHLGQRCLMLLTNMASRMTPIMMPMLKRMSLVSVSSSAASGSIDPSSTLAVARTPSTMPLFQSERLNAGTIYCVCMRFDMASVMVPSMPYPVEKRTLCWSITKRMSSPLSLFFFPMPHLRNRDVEKSKMSFSPMDGSITTAVSMPVDFSSLARMAFIVSVAAGERMLVGSETYRRTSVRRTLGTSSTDLYSLTLSPAAHAVTAMRQAKSMVWRRLIINLRMF